MFEILSVCKGGGYRYCRTSPPHPKRNSKGLYPLHRVLVENKLGRLLAPNEEVHHIDENKQNDDPENLEVKTKAEHCGYHRRTRIPDPVKVTCPCGKEFKLIPSIFRRRMSLVKTGKIYCSHRCSGKLSRA